MLEHLFGDRAFRRRVMTVVMPIIIQNGITNFVSLLDNIMVGQVGTIPMSGVSIVNSLLFIFYLCIFGASAGAGIFTAQFYGSGDNEGVRHTFRFKFMICLLIAVVGIGIFSFAGRPLISLYLTGDGDAAIAEGSMEYGLKYLAIMLWGFVPFAVTNTYSATMRETGETMVPMIAGVSAVLTNLVFNYILIFGHFGAPRMGVEGAAWATVISRFVELGICALWCHSHPSRYAYIPGVYRTMAIPGPIMKRIIVKGMPLLANEFFWSCGVAAMNQCYSTCGLNVVPAMNISSTLINLGSVVFMAMGNAVGILMGQLLGSGASKEQALDANRKLTCISVFSGLVFGIAVLFFSGVFPKIYNTSEDVRNLATLLICINAAAMPFHAYANATYFTLRSGGQTLVTFLFDSCFMCFVSVPIAFCISRFTNLGILPLFTICQFLDVLKCAIGYVMLKQGKWIQNLTV